MRSAFSTSMAVGAVGAVSLGVLLNDDPVTTGRIAALSLIVGGIVLAKLA
jgi:quaternary ammonium compound-resistance protein SugE